MFEWLSRLFRRRERPVAQGDIFSQLAWLGPDENPFHIRVLDCRPFSTAMISTTQDPSIAARFGQLRSASGEEHRGRHPEDAVVARCELSYPLNSESRDGPLFLAQQMEDKWDIYLYDGHLYFARSWTGDLVFRAAFECKEKEAVITAVEASRAQVMGDAALAVRAVDFLVKTHLCRQEAPHPFPQGFPEDKKALAVYSFSGYGRWAFYGSFEDTTKARPRAEAAGGPSKEGQHDR
jgi:hypothetical protein